jgi:hypothetical protein
MSTLTLERLFRSSNGSRDKFLARLFGIFSEDIVRMWCKDFRSPYENIGRPTIRPTVGGKGYTLDFALRHKQTGAIFLSEMKCELEYEGYKYLVLTSPSQLDHHKGAAFQIFLDSIQNQDNYTVTINGKTHKVSGAILIWGHCTDEGRASVSSSYGFDTVLSLQDIANELRAWKSGEYIRFLNNRQEWCNQLFTGLRD